MTRILAVMNQKGGVGKTTTVLNLAAALADAGRRVLAIDLDPQANLTLGLGVIPSTVSRSIYHVMVDPKGNLADAVMTTAFERLDLVPSHIDLSGAEIEMGAMYGREVRLRRSMGDLPERYDYVLIDCQPSLSMLGVNAMTAAREVIIAMQAHPFALEGLSKLFDVIELVRGRLNPEVRVTGVLVTLFDKRTRVSREVYDALQKNPDTGPRLYKTIIPLNVKIAESQRVGTPVIHYAPQSQGAKTYTAFAEEVMAQETATGASGPPAVTNAAPSPEPTPGQSAPPIANP